MDEELSGGMPDLCSVSLVGPEAEEQQVYEEEFEGEYDAEGYEDERDQLRVSSRSQQTIGIQSNGTPNLSMDSGQGKQQQNPDDVYLYREITFLLESSLSDMNRDPKASVVKMKEWVEYGLFEDNLNSKKTKETASHLITGMFLTGARNEFPATFAISPIGIEIPTYKRISDSGVCGACIIEAGANFRNSMIPIFDATRMKTDSPLLKKYPDRNLDNLDDGITYFQGKALVEENHPVLEYFNIAREKKGLSPLGLDNQSEEFPGSYTVSQTDTKRCVEELKKNWEKGSKRNNLYNLGFKFERAFLSKPIQADPVTRGAPGISRNSGTANGTQRKTLNMSSNTQISAKGDLPHDGREIFFGVTAEEPKKFVASDPKKCIISVLVKYKI